MDTVSFIDQLQQQLAQYGLDPRQWQIAYAGGVTFRIWDNDTEFIGRACPEKVEWLQLRLAAI